MKTLNFLILIFICNLGFSQTSCNYSHKSDLTVVIDLVFKDELKSKDSIVLRNNFRTASIKKAIKNEKIKIWNDNKLLKHLYDNYFTIEQVEIYEDMAKIVYIQRKRNLFFKFYLFKEDNKWKIANKKFKRQGRLKGHDFLLATISKLKLEKE